MLSRRSLGLWLLAGIVSVGGVACWRGIAHQRKPNPSYQGKPLEYWFNQLPMTSKGMSGGSDIVVQGDRMQRRGWRSGTFWEYGSWKEKPEASAKAIRAMGTNAVAFSLHKLTRQNYPIESKIERLAFGVGLHGLLFEDTTPEREQSVTALILLKPLPREAVSKLITLSTNKNGAIAAAARCALATEADELVLTGSGKPRLPRFNLKTRSPLDSFNTLFPLDLK